MDKKIYRSRRNKVIAGVCGGLGEYFSVDPVIIRILFIGMTVFGGSGLLLYIVCAIIIPKNPKHPTGTEDESESKKINTNKMKLFIGVAVIATGVFLILNKFNISFFPSYLFSLKHYFGMFFWPILLIIIGSLLILSYKKQDDDSEFSGKNNSGKGFYRSREDKKWLGLCGGIAEYFKIDSSIVRISYIFVTFYSGIFPGIIAYIVASLVIPEKPIKIKSHKEESKENLSEEDKNQDEDISGGNNDSGEIIDANYEEHDEQHATSPDEDPKKNDENHRGSQS